MTDTQTNRTSAPIFNAPPVVIGLIAVLAAIHVGLWLLGEEWQALAFEYLALIPARFVGRAHVPGSEYWSLLTYAFLHGDWMHILFNSLWLLVFGTPVARFMGARRFLLLSAIASVAGGLSSLILHWGEDLYVIGASGAVSGLLAAAIPLMYARRLPGGGGRPLTFRELLTDRNALIFMALWLAITLASGATGWVGNGFVTESGIAWEAHIGGFLAGLAGFYGIIAWQMRRR